MSHTQTAGNYCNDSDKEFDRQNRLTSKVARHHQLLEGETLHFLWPISAAEWLPSRPHAESLCREARNVLALGWGIDQVVGEGRILNGTEADALPGRRWRAWSGHRPGQRTWRVPVADSLDDLEVVHESFQKRVSGMQYHPSLNPRRFKTIAYLSVGALPLRSYAAFEMSEGVAFRQEDAIKIATMLRSLACRCAKADTHGFPGGPESYVAGHVSSQVEAPPRFSYMPLPTIGHEHADGMIRRILIAEPYGGDGSHARWAQHRLRNQEFRDKHGKEQGILLDLWRPGSEAMIQRYAGVSRTWSTVTPVILPGHDDHDPRRKAPKLILKAVGQAGLPVDAVEDFSIRKAPYWPGAQHPRHYLRPDYLQQLPAWHVWIHFREPIPGPLSIGAGRHCGLGLMARADSP